MEKQCVGRTILGKQCSFLARPNSNYCGTHGNSGGRRHTVKKAAKKAAKKK